MGRMMLGAFLVTTAMACASGGTGRGAVAHEMLRLAGSRESNPPRDGTESFVIDTLALPAEEAFTAVRGAYSAIGIPFTFFEADQLRLGGFVAALGELGDDRPSTFVDCGQGAVDIYADAYDVSMAIATRVVPVDSTTSTVETVLRARARARDVSADLLRCRSFGAFEGRIADLARQRAGT